MDFEININEKTLDFIKTLQEDVIAKIYSLLEVLSIKGNELREPYSKALGSGLFELRIKGKDNIVRLFYAFQRGKQIYVLHGFIKKTQTTPKKELEIAYQRLKELNSKEK